MRWDARDLRDGEDASRRDATPSGNRLRRDAEPACQLVPGSNGRNGLLNGWIFHHG